MPTKPENGKRDILTTIVVLLLLTVVGAGVGFATGSLLSSTNTAAKTPDELQGTEAAAAPAGDSTNAPEEEEPEDVKSSLQDVKIIPFPPVLTTLADPRGTWIRLEGSILVRPAAETPPERLAEEAGEQILTYLRSVRLNQLESSSGVLGLKDDLDDTVRTLSGGEIQGILIHGLVVE